MNSCQVLRIKKLNSEFIKRIIEEAGPSIRRCVQCGRCTASCPSGWRTAFNTRRLIREATMGFKEKVLKSDDLWMCTTCSVCVDRCPEDVRPAMIIRALRNLAVREGFMKEPHKRAARFFIETGHLVPINDTYKGLRRELGLQEMSPSTQKYPEALDEVKTIIKLLEFDKLVQ